MRSPGRKALALVAMLWAVGLPIFLFLHDLREDNTERQLRALATSRLGAAPEDYATNSRVSIPKGSVEMVSNLSSAVEQRSRMFTYLIWVSSAFTLVLSALLFQDPGHERTEA